MNIDEAFWSKVEKTPNGCWNWTAGRSGDGYGNFRSTRAHRWAYERLVGPIPAGLVIDHLCRNILCVNPAHLEPVSRRENVLRGLTLPASNAAKTHCPKGHPLSGNNLYVQPRTGKRRCKTCPDERRRARQ